MPPKPPTITDVVTEETILVYRGEDFDVNLTTPNNIAGWAIEFNIEGATPEECLTLSPAVIVNGPQGQYRFSLDKNQTNKRPGQYQYDAWRIDPGLERPLAVGLFVVVDVARVTPTP